MDSIKTRDTKPGEVPRRIYVECTYTFLAGGNSGIRRVARNIANHGPKVSTPGTIIKPAVWAGVGFFSPKKPLGESPHWVYRVCAYSSRLLVKLVGYVTSFVSVVVRPLPDGIRIPLRDFARRLTKGMRVKTNSNVLYTVLGFLAFPVRFFLARPISFEPGDTIVLMDSTWNSKSMRDYLVKARLSRQVLLGVMIHDLFPLTLPETCQRETVEGFGAWFRDIVVHADFFVTNSEATRHALKEYLERHAELRPFRYPSSSFTLGAELDLKTSVSPKVSTERLWSVPGAAVVAVGTIEPRKNYEFLLDAFDLLVSRDVDMTLIIVGRVGWKSEEVVNRIETHPELGHRLLHLADANDADLVEIFQRVDCLVCCSIAEGFGLPVVEGLSQGLTVFASDIPPFREVGGDACGFFSLNSPEDLADKLAQWVEDYTRGESQPQPFDWPDWNESARQFRETVRNLLPPPSAIG
jgi:glycosyltransferase involved in cell wall biosynthesis